MMAGPADRTSLRLAVDFLRALEHHEFFLAYQPIIDLRSRSVVAAEALVRWNRPQAGVIGPDHFLGHIERAGLGGMLTAFVVSEALRQSVAWSAAGLDLTVAVNVFPADLTDDNLYTTVESLLAEAGLDPARLILEVTERTAVLSLEAVDERLVALTALGVRLSLDDFGIGDSSLARLQRLHVDEVKLDRSFIQSVATSRTDRHIVTFATKLAHDLGRRVVAEGVEEDRVLDALEPVGVDYVQGFRFAPALAPDDLAEYVGGPQLVPGMGTRAHSRPA